MSSLSVFNNTYGSRWQNPFTILPGRFAKFGLQLDFMSGAAAHAGHRGHR